MRQEEAGPVTAYSVVLPPGWVRIPLREGTRAALDEKVFRGIEQVPADVPRDRATAYRLHVRRTVERMAEQARQAGGLDLYVPARPRGRAVPASFLVSEIVREDTARTEDVLVRLVADRRAGEAGELRLVGEAAAVRWEYVAPPADEDGGADTYSRHVDYVLPVPGDRTRWLVVSHATAGDGDPHSRLTRALTDLFDALMTTFRWSAPETG